MTGETGRPPKSLDASTPNIARMNDYFLGGKDNFAADRKAADELLALAPEIKLMAEDNHAFQGRLVRYLLGEGVRQIITIGSGLPTRHNVHEVAREVVPDARVVYVNDDEVVLAHARALLGKAPGTLIVDGDVLHPDELLAAPALRGLIDFDRPVAVLLFGVLQFIPDEDGPFECVRRLLAPLASGSHLGLSHVVFDSRPDLAEPIVDIYRQILSRTEDASRTRQQVLKFFDGLELLDPGLVNLHQWHPDDSRTNETAWIVGGLARKP